MKVKTGQKFIIKYSPDIYPKFLGKVFTVKTVYDDRTISFIFPGETNEYIISVSYIKLKTKPKPINEL